MLNPQMTGLATFPGEEIVKESTVQSPIEFPKKNHLKHWSPFERA